ncbi:contractile injection system tape measure protein [Cardinium endosymbiont of Oedothorax gibbosus]|uniref:contractile injection system tape measure protein n=1 Tax=Cardinium endosymbiont of Oedothorax gibbosus TaxID=931101 RepID=UPI0020251320|nr:contractile injection system tape measure protein [Cardinium endosymbiont of Oedothorax gibbosus]CAH2559647.1 Afp14-like phage contractile injection system tape measure protein [Cardinium endosymbiont of Oedothorax gibbosus]
MPITSCHVILRSRIEVTIDQHSQNSMLQHIIHKIIRKRIMPILSKLFAQYVPNDVVIHLDKIAIDVGSFNLSSLDKQLPCQVEQMLTLKLKEQIGKVIHNPTWYQVIPLPDAKRQAIAHYLSEGNFAWWMVERCEKQIEKIYLALLRHTPLLIEQLWYNLTKKEKAVQRCIAIFSPATLEHTLACLLKQPIKYFKPILAETGLLLYQAKILPNLLYTPGQQVLSMTLLGMINQQRSKIDRMGLLRMLLQQVAIQTSTSYEKILEKLHTYCAQNEEKSSYDPTIKALVLQLRDLLITPPKFWYQDIKNQEKVLKELDKIGNNTMAFYQLSVAMSGIKIAMDKAGIGPLVKSWLQEEKNREKLAKNLPDTLFVAFLESIDPSIVSIFSDFMQISTATNAAIALVCAIKAITLAYCAFGYAQTLYFEEIQSLFRKYIANSLINKQRLSALLTTQTYNLAIKAIMVPLASTAILPSDAFKTTIYQDGLHHPPIVNPLQPIVCSSDATDRKVSIHRPIIERSLAQHMPIAMKFLDRLETVLIALLQTTECQVNIDSIKNMLITAATVDPPITERHYIARIVDYLMPYTPFSYDILCDRLLDRATQAGYQHLAACFSSLASFQNDAINKDNHYIVKGYSAAELLDTLQTKYYTAHLDRDPISVEENPLSDVVDFLAYNELPPNQLVPAYLIVKCLGRATPQQIRDQLAPLCREAAILKKLMQHATEVTLSKLLQAFIPFSNQMLDGLERVIIQSKMLQSTQQQTNIRLIKEIFIAAAITHTPPEKQYIERILLHLSAQASCRPTTLCNQLIDAAKQATDYYLVEAFSILKEKLAPLNLNKIDDVDLIFLSTHEKLDQALLPLYYNNLLPAIKHRVRQSDDLSQSMIDQLVAQHLPTIAKPLQETISIALYKQITDAVRSKRERVAQGWYLFLHTGKLENYADGTALLNDVITHLPTFSLAQHKIHVRQRLIVHFTHTQLMLLVQRHSEIGKTLADFIKGSYQLWCTTQGSLGQPNSTKNVFWDSVLKTLPHTSISKENWLAQITTEWSNVLEITPTTLLETFQLLDTEGIPEELITSLNRLQEKYRQEIQQQAIQRGYKAPILTKLYLLLNGTLSLCVQQYHLSMPTLGNALVQFMADQPSTLANFLEAQDNHQLVARRMVHYFSQEVTTKIIASLAKDNARFVTHYLDLLSNPLQHETVPLYHPSTWNRALYISIIYYLITKKPFEATEFVHSTVLTTCYPKEAIYKIITSIVATKAINQEEDKIITLLKPLIKHINPPTMSQPALANHSLETVSVTKQKEPSPKVSLPEEEVRVYTKNTGLVFLWPFLYDFFKVHNLMVGNQFFCDQAAHNAVYLLQYLVTGQLKSPEWQLTLPKLLCGLSYDEVLLPYRPINEGCDAYRQEAMKEMIAEPEQPSQQASTEKIEESGSISNSAMEVIAVNSQLLIKKVIKRWKSLTKLKAMASYQGCTTQDILKSYFLNRLGILTRQKANDATESKFWHLTIMHQEHDTGDLVPPWSITSIKLPWMQEAIILFWMPA